MLDWKDKDGKVVLEETKRVQFGGGADVFWMDHDITLQRAERRRSRWATRRKARSASG